MKEWLRDFYGAWEIDSGGQFPAFELTKLDRSSQAVLAKAFRGELRVDGAA